MHVATYRLQLCEQSYRRRPPEVAVIARYEGLDAEDDRVLERDGAVCPGRTEKSVGQVQDRTAEDGDRSRQDRGKERLVVRQQGRGFAGWAQHSHRDYQGHADDGH